MTRSTQGAQPQRTVNDWSRLGTIAHLINHHGARVRPTVTRAVAEHDQEDTERIALLLFRLGEVQRHAHTGDEGRLQTALAKLSAASDDWNMLLLERKAQR